MSEFADWRPAPNIRDAPDLYEIENRAIDPEGDLLAALSSLAPWADRDLVDLGCGTGSGATGMRSSRSGAKAERDHRGPITRS